MGMIDRGSLVSCVWEHSGAKTFFREAFAFQFSWRGNFVAVQMWRERLFMIYWHYWNRWKIEIVHPLSSAPSFGAGIWHAGLRVKVA